MSVAPTRLEVAIAALERIAAEAAYLEEAGGDRAVIGAWAREALAEVGNPPTPSNAPSSAWMEAVARRAARAAFAYCEAHAMSEQQWKRVMEHLDEGVAAAVKVAMKEPPPAGPGGPNDGPA